MIRTFLALELPEEFKRELIRKIRDLKSSRSDGIKWAEDENLHITLQFIGDTKEEHLEDFCEGFYQVFSACSPLRLSNPLIEIIPGKFPRIIWVDFEAQDKEIFKISRQIKNIIIAQGYHLEKRPLKIHATMGRVKKKLSENLVSEILSSEIKIKQIDITRATFYQSILKPEGPQYHEIASYDLEKE